MNKDYIKDILYTYEECDINPNTYENKTLCENEISNIISKPKNKE